MADYPNRESHFANKFTRLLLRTCAAQDIGQAACLLLVQIVFTEDAARYRRPVTFWNAQLESVLGLSKKQLIPARARAIEAGWLHYEKGGKSKVGKYWVTVPVVHENLPDHPIDEDFLDLSVPPEAPNKGPTTGGIGDVEGTTMEPKQGQERDHNGTTTGPLSNLRPKPSPKPKSLLVDDVKPPLENGDDGKPPNPPPKLRFDAEHSDLAKHMFARIQDVMPGTPVPVYGKWAHQLRVMVERDGLPLDQIKKVFDWANTNDFWKTNIKSPGKLREQFPTLLAKMEKTSAKPNPSQRHDRDRPVEAI